MKRVEMQLAQEGDPELKIILQVDKASLAR